MKVAVVGGMKSLVADYTRIAREQGFEVLNRLYGDWDLLHLVYPLSRQGVQQWFNAGTNQKVLLHFQGDDTRPRNAFHYWWLKRLIEMGSAVAYSTPDLEYNLDWLAPDLPRFHLPVPINTKLFKPQKRLKAEQPLIAGELYKMKHWEQRFKELKGREFDMIDWGLDREYYKDIAPKGTRWFPKQDYDSMPDLYTSYNEVVPQASEAFEMLGAMGRVELEALACGCKLVGYPRYDRNYVVKNHSNKVVGKKLAKIYNEVCK